jgi:hypothetical protein
MLHRRDWVIRRLERTLNLSIDKPYLNDIDLLLPAIPEETRSYSRSSCFLARLRGATAKS